MKRMQQKQEKITRKLSPVRHFKFLVFLCWMHFCEAVESKENQELAPLALKLVRLTAALTAIVCLGFVIMQKEPYVGMLIILAYSTMAAVHAIYSTLRLRLSKQRVYWVGE